MLSTTDIERFDRDGFLVLPELIDRPLLDELRRAYDEVIERRVTASGDRMLGGITRQVMYPSSAHPVLDRNDAVRTGIRMGRQLLGRDDVHRSFDMLIDKPPGHPHETPWHQDMAYSEHPFAPAGRRITLESIQIWIALDDVDDDNGCMHFAAGFHRRPLLEHHVASGDPADDGRLLALVDPVHQLAGAHTTTACLAAGGATIHSYGTPHHTGPNRTDRSRRAYIFNVATPDGMRGIGHAPERAASFEEG